MIVEERLRKFQFLLDQQPQDGLAGSIEILLNQLDPGGADLLRLCAIPHQFRADIMRELQPDLDGPGADALFAKFSELSVILILKDEIALHDDARKYLFGQWLRPDRIARFQEASAALFAHFDRKTEGLSGIRQDISRRNRMFHLLGADQNRGFLEFGDLIREMRYQNRISDCKTLIDLVHEYDSVLQPANSSWLAYHEAKLAADLRQWTKAQELFERVLDDGASPPALKLRALNRLGIIQQEQRNWATATVHFQQAIGMAREQANQKQLLYRILHNLGTVYRDCGRLQDAEVFLEESLELAQQENDYSSLATGYNSKATLERKHGNFREAVQLYMESLACLGWSGDRFRSAQVHNNLGLIHADLNDWKSSEACFLKSLEIKQQAGDTLGQAATLNNLVRVYQNLDMPQKATEVSVQAISLFHENKDFYNVALANRNLGKLFRRLRQPEVAGKYFHEAVTFFTTCGEVQEAESARAELDSLYRKKIGLPWWAYLGAALMACLLIALFALIITGIFIS